MRFTLIFLFLTIASLAKRQTIDNSKIRFDGFYQSIAQVGPIGNQDNDTAYYYLRFYSTGRVISVSSDGTANDLKRWFKLGKDNVSVGSFEIAGKKLYFSTTAKEGSVIYRGKIKNPYYLVLRAKSLINGHRGRNKYYFVAVPDLD